MRGIKHIWIRTQLLPAEGLRVRVETEENLLVGERVLVLGPRAAGDLGVGGADDGMDLGAVDEVGDIRVGDLGCREEVVWKAAESNVPKTSSRRANSACPDNEVADMATGRELGEFQAGDADDFDAGRLRNAQVIPLSPKHTRSGPRRWLWRRLRIFPLPAWRIPSQHRRTHRAQRVARRPLWSSLSTRWLGQ